MTDLKSTWDQVSDRLEGLGLKLKLHMEQTRDGTMAEALEALRNNVESAFEAAGNAVKDEAVRADVREVGQLVADAVSSTMAKVEQEVRSAVKHKS
jgi:Flp pilus assembly pilin Flp